MIPANKLPGHVWRLTDRSVFKLGLVIGPSRAIGKVRIRPWQAGPKSWSAAQTIAIDRLAEIRVTDLTPRQARIYHQAVIAKARAT